VAWSYLDFGGFCRLPLDQGDTDAEQENGEPLHAAQGAVQHQHHAQRRARDLQLVGDLHTPIYTF